MRFYSIFVFAHWRPNYRISLMASEQTFKLRLFVLLFIPLTFFGLRREVCRVDQGHVSQPVLERLLLENRFYFGWVRWVLELVGMCLRLSEFCVIFRLLLGMKIVKIWLQDFKWAFLIVHLLINVKLRSCVILIEVTHVRRALCPLEIMR